MFAFVNGLVKNSSNFKTGKKIFTSCSATNINLKRIPTYSKYPCDNDMIRVLHTKTTKLE